MKTGTSSKLKVGVIFGGRSGEHEVSLVSANSIMKALNPDKYEIIPVGITRQGSWLVGVKPEAMLEDKSDKGKTCVPYAGGPNGKANLNCDPSNKGLILVNKPQTENHVALDLLFPVIHGTYGEDGTLQGLLEQADMPYVGCGVLASAAGMDKTIAKKLFRDAGIAVAPFKEILRSAWKRDPEAILAAIEKEFSYPCFVKPVNSGSSVGISKARDKATLREAIDQAARFDRKILIESFVNGREIEVSVLGNDDPIASVPGEIVPCNEFYDYTAKYVDDRSELKIPADLSPDITEEIRRLAIKAYRALDCAGMARVDFFLERATNRIIINEINTIPGFTKISMYPKLWEATGISYSELCDRLIDLALERYRDKQESLAAVI
ncbi:MAG: D-alanine-D-alanine ligase [Clostridiales bacterium]|jgi:D-alanine-D-alanine ligase|nr:D-alanine-D-alanine ligase [Clostridiales bacterium]MDN5281489.1 D-alanine-D-alanine ligase [Candidatus Ozemobacter sp.]